MGIDYRTHAAGHEPTVSNVGFSVISRKVRPADGLQFERVRSKAWRSVSGSSQMRGFSS